MFLTTVKCAQFIIAIILLTMVFAGCNREEPAVNQSATSDASTDIDTADAEPYLLDYCMVSGEKLGSMGEPIRLVHDGREIQFCCSGCVDEFKVEPAKFLTKIDEAMASTDQSTQQGNHHEHHDHAH